MPEIFEELDRQADKWEPTAAAYLQVVQDQVQV